MENIFEDTELTAEEKAQIARNNEEEEKQKGELHRWLMGFFAGPAILAVCSMLNEIARQTAITGLSLEIMHSVETAIGCAVLLLYMLHMGVIWRTEVKS